MLQPVDGAPRLLIDRIPSRYLGAYLALIHSCVFASLWFYPFPALIKGLLAVLLLWHGCYSLRRYNSAGHRWWITRLQTRGDCLYAWHNNQAVSVSVEQATLWSWLIVVNLRQLESGRQVTVVFFPDSADREQQRQLRVWLRHCLSARV